MLPCTSATSTPTEDEETHDISSAVLNISGELSKSWASLTCATSKNVNWRHCERV